MILLKAKVDVPNLVTYLNRHLYLSGTWFGVAPIIDTERNVFKRD
jgi:hypothetical protein